MSLLHPEFLYYMLPPLFILFGFLLTQKEAQATFFSDEVIDKLRVTSNTLTLKARNALFMMIGVLIVFALAGPVIKDGKVEIKAKSADIMIALDISDSMLAEDVYPNRLKLAKQKALEFIQDEPQERIGVIAFAQNSYLVSPLSFDHSAVGFLLKKLSTNSITEQGTNFLSMLEVVDNSIKKSDKKYLLILSDGGDKKDFSKEIAYAKEKNIAVFILGVGTKKGAPIKKENGEFIKQNGKIIVSKLNENISKLATQTGGAYIQSVNSDADVKAMIKEIKAHSTQKELKSQEIARFIPLFYYPLGLALALLLIATSSMSKREKVEVPAMFLLFLALGSFTPELRAGVLDFMKLEEAKKAYESGDYAKSEKLYSEYATSSENGQTYYNKANALYKQGKFKEAVQNYERAVFDDKGERAQNFANLGNAYVKQGGNENLQEAIKAYEDSLKIKEDKDVRENLEAVKKALEQQKKNKDNKNKDKKEQKKNKQNKDKKNDKNKKDQDKKDQQNKDQNSKGDQDKQDKKNKTDSKDKKQDKKKKDKKKDPAKELKDKEKKKQDKEKKQDISNAKVSKKKAKMSDAEEKKWMKALNANQNTFMYMLNNNKPVKEDTNEKPW